MVTRYLKTVLMLCVAVMLGGCVYDFEPDKEQLSGLDKPLLVIEGDIIVGGYTQISLSSTRSVFGETENVFIDFSGASVWVESESGEIYSGYPTNMYLINNVFTINTNYLPRQGKYRLCVSVPGRGEYHSAFKSVCVSPQIDSISFTIADDRNSVQFDVSTHNNDTEPLYCRWSFVEDWESNAPIVARLNARKLPGSNIIVFDELTDEEIDKRRICYSKGNSNDIYISSTEKLSENIIYRERLNVVAAGDRRLSSLYSLTVTQTAMDSEAYKYWEGVKSSINGTGGLFAPMPNEIKGNIVCDTNPDEPVLGYINVSTVTYARRMFYYRDIPLYKNKCSEALYPDLTPQDLFTSGMQPVRYGEKKDGEVNKSEVYWASAECTNCSFYSNSTRPDFWPEGR